MKADSYYVYIVECADGTFYTGYTSSLNRRLDEHNYSIKKAAKYTRSRRPVRLVSSEQHDSISAAMKREYRIKKMTRIKKYELIKSACNQQNNKI